MAGFMSGFGPAFANSFSRAREASAQREQDMFKLKYADYISRRDQIESEKKQDAKDVEYAKSVAQQYGNPDAWGEIYKMKRSGVPDSQIFKRLDEYEPVISPMETSKGDTSGPADPRDGLTQGAQSSVDAQMSESGMQPPANGGIFGDLKGGLGIGSSLGMKPRGSREERVTGRIAEASGTTPDEINKTLQPRDGEPMTAVPDLKVAWKPRTKPTDWYDVKTMNDAAVNLTKAERTGNPEDIATAKAVYEALVVEDEAKSMRDAQAKGLAYSPRLAFVESTGGYARKQGNVWVDTVSGKVVGEGEIRPFTLRDAEMAEEVIKESATVAKPFMEKATGFSKSVREAADMYRIVDQNPGVMSWGGALANSADQAVRNVAGVVDLFKNKDPNAIINPGEIDSLIKYEEQLQQSLSQLVPADFANNVQAQAMARSLLEIKAVKFAYAQAASVGQTGQGVSAKEFERFYNTAINPNTPAWKQEMADFITNGYENLKQEGAVVNQFGGNARAFEVETGFKPPVMPLQDIDQLLGPDTLQFVNQLKDQKMTNDPMVSNPNQMKQTDIPEGYKPTGTFTPDGKPLYVSPDGQKGTLE